MDSSFSTTNIDGKKVRLTPLATINMAAIASGDKAETEKLYAMCQKIGFFYLDLTEPYPDFDPQSYLHELQDLYRIQAAYFQQSLDTKKEDLINEKVEAGYHHYPDCETFEIPLDYLSEPVRPLSSTLNVPKSREFSHASHNIVTTLLHSLSSSLRAEHPHIPPLEIMHDRDEPSGSGLKLESVPTVENLEDVPFSEHKDGGTLTLLYCDDYTTELQDVETGIWGFIQPKKGHAIVNVSNALETLSEGKLRSALHRVGQPTPGVKDRRCVLYYLRPARSSGLYN